LENNSYNELEVKIDNLKEIISKVNTIEILLAINHETLIVRENYQERIGLTSPFSQFQYLYGLAVSTEKIQDIVPLDDELWGEIKKLLNQIFYCYGDNFFPKEYKSKENINMKLLEESEISMSAFIEYFNNLMLCYVEQIVDRIKRWFKNYDNVVKSETNCSVNDFLDFYGFIVKSAQKKWKLLYKQREKIYEIHREINEGLCLSEFDCFLKTITLYRNLERLEREFDKLCEIKICRIKQRFGEEKTISFLNLFTISENNRNFRYYTEENPVSAQPIFKINDKELLNLNNRFLMNAIYVLLNDILEKSRKKEKFFKTRSIESENKTLSIFKVLFKDRADYFQNIFEEPNTQFEHDILIVFEKIIFIIEVKSSKKREPLRNPEKAFKRIEDDFNRDNGIQKAFEQALHLKDNILNNKKTILYDKRGNVATEILRDSIDEVYIICVTRESFGAIATNLSLLLTKPDEEKYPWCVNIFDLENIIDGFCYKKLKPEKFMYYLQKRSELHKIIYTTDELDIAGYFLCYGDFKDIESKRADRVFLSPIFCDIFDKIYYEKRGIKYNFEVDEKPSYIDIKKEFEKFNRLTREQFFE
jgi:hypothetical protein